MIERAAQTAIISIPHRQDKKGGMEKHKNSERTKFQFLIGRIKSAIDLGYDYYHVIFQFLIGRIKRLYCFFFQRYYLISIPHRQDKKFFFFVSRAKLHFVFQFLIGRIKSRDLVREPDMTLLFQFLIGRIKRVL